MVVVWAGVCIAQQSPSTDQLPEGVTAGNPTQQTFHIRPLKPVEELRREALQASPPHEGGKRKPDLVELVKLVPTIHLDIRYASSNNFMGTPFYSEARAFLQRPAAEAVVRASAELKHEGYGLLVHDAYRPWYVTKMFWDGTPDDKKIFVADPKTGSNHNRGCAVDITLYDLTTGKEVRMRAATTRCRSGRMRIMPAEPRKSGGCAFLRTAMEKQGFQVYPYEWWHFDYKDWKEYPLMNIRFEELR
jgi:zinc D-Ala-D-Ala dipeptidase